MKDMRLCIGSNLQLLDWSQVIGPQWMSIGQFFPTNEMMSSFSMCLLFGLFQEHFDEVSSFFAITFQTSTKNQLICQQEPLVKLAWSLEFRIRLFRVRSVASVTVGLWLGKG